MDLRYSVGTTDVRAKAFAVVWDHARGEQFCLINPADCFGGMETAKARAADIASMFNSALISPEPIPMLLFCPSCGQQHIDQPDAADNWDNPPHKSHKCVGPNGCGTVWRPADIATTGVEAITTLGEKDSWSAADGAVLLTIDDLGCCELCDKPLALGQFVNEYDDVGTAHANCKAPFARPAEETPAPDDDGTTMPTYVLLGEPALLFDVADPPSQSVSVGA